MEEIIKHINDTNASYRAMGAGDAKNTDLFLDNEHYDLFKDSGEQIIVRYNKENLTKAILFIASLLPRKYDNSAIHKTIYFSTEFVYDQLAFLDGFFTVDGVKVESRTQKWNARKDVLKSNGEIDKRFYFNGLLEEIEYINYKGERKSAKFTIRNYFAGGYSDLHIKKADDGIFDIWITNTQTPYDDGKEKCHEIKDVQSFSLQQIFYGAPGTGKSRTIKDQTVQAENEGRVIRTTFHPDSDYSTFVGCYKPSMTNPDRIYSAEELAVKLKEIKNTGVPYPCHKFAAKYWKSLKDLNVNTVKEILAAAGFTEAYGVEVSKGVAIGQEYLNREEDGKIIYTFTPQVFTNAYVKAWNTTEDVYLIIEEINRGNCAQIFGDLFQLLDRGDNGFSEYPIEADTDLRNYIAKELENSTRSDFPDGVKDGRKLVLPQNLYIWATMNTSDQSLFPIDSAFKRRWDWQYVPIYDGGKGWWIKADGKRYDWWQFVDAMNDKIGAATYSEDKKLGYFFCKAKDGVIDAETFVGKVVFYIWNDVFKDFAEEAGNLFKDVDGSMLSFNKFYTIGTDGKRMVVEPKIAILMQNLGVEPITISDSANDEVVGDVEEEMQNDIFGNQKKETLISISIPNHPIIKSSDSNQFDAFIKALRIIGFERIRGVVQSLKYKRLGGCPVISTQRNEVIDNNNKGYSYYQEGELYIIKGCKYYTYIRILEDLNSMLNIGLTMETK